MLSNLQLNRIDYANVGVTSRATTVLLPATDLTKPTHSFAVGDHDGVLHIYGFKRGEFQVLFKSLPGPKISKVVLGGTIAPKDKIFISHGNTVRGFTRKGKMFLEFDTSLMESISAMYVLNADLATCSRDIYHRYRECRDADSYLAGEKLHDVILLPVSSSGAVVAVLACGDCAIRVLSGTKSPTILRLPSIPTVLTPLKEGDAESVDQILLGTIDGKVGLLNLDSEKAVRISWILNTSASEVTSLISYQIEDSLDLVVGRQDGSVEVFSMPSEEDTIPLKRFHYGAGESISSVLGGRIGSADHPELLVTTYSGKIFGLSTQSSENLRQAYDDAAIAKLTIEVEQLQEELKKEYTGSAFAGESLTPLVLSFNHRFSLNVEDASYTFLVELDRAIDNILVQSDVPIDLLDVEGNNAVMSLSSRNPNDGNFILATYRCQDNTNRLEIRLRSIEGQSGTIQIYVTSQLQPKCCRKIVVPLCALSLHARMYVDNKEEILTGPCNELRLTGGFSLAEMHAWLALSLPDVPERPLVHEDEAEALLVYKSSAVGSILKCKYKKGLASFSSENITSIIILRDILTKEATNRKIKLEVFCDVTDASIPRVIEMIFPKLKEATEIMKKNKILDALELWEIKNNPAELCTVFQQLINNEAELRLKRKRDPDALKKLQGIIIDLYVDWERAKGSRRISIKQAEERLHVALESMNLAMILQAFVLRDTLLGPGISAPVLL